MKQTKKVVEAGQNLYCESLFTLDEKGNMVFKERIDVGDVVAEDGDDFYTCHQDEKGSLYYYIPTDRTN